MILTFSKNLRCLNLALTQAQKSVTRHFWWLKELCIFFILALSKNFSSFLEFFCWQHCSHTGKFKHLKILENVKIIGTNNIDSILINLIKTNPIYAVLMYSCKILNWAPCINMVLGKAKTSCGKKTQKSIFQRWKQNLIHDKGIAMANLMGRHTFIA